MYGVTSKASVPFSSVSNGAPGVVMVGTHWTRTVPAPWMETGKMSAMIVSSDGARAAARLGRGVGALGGLALADVRVVHGRQQVPRIVHGRPLDLLVGLRVE